jgi:hypothetical protein
MRAFVTDRVWRPVVAGTAIQIGISITVEIYLIGIPAMVRRQAIGVHGWNQPQAHMVRHILGMGTEMIQELFNESMSIGFKGTVYIPYQCDLEGAIADAMGNDVPALDGLTNHLREVGVANRGGIAGRCCRQDRRNGSLKIGGWRG